MTIYTINIKLMRKCPMDTIMYIFYFTYPCPKSTTCQYKSHPGSRFEAKESTLDDQRLWKSFFPNKIFRFIFFLTTMNSTLRYECDETFSDECEFAARAEGE